MMKTVVMQVIPLKHMEDHAGAHGRLYSGAGGCVLKEAAAMEISHWNRVLAVCGGEPMQEGAGFLARPVTPWGTHMGTICF